MPVLVNLRHLEDGPIRLSGQVPLEELDLEGLDEVLRAAGGLEYDVTVERLAAGLLAAGEVRMGFEADCVRCLRVFSLEVRIGDWQVLLELEGEEAVLVKEDCVDLTPRMREDILLALPQHPLCDPGCGGLPQASASQAGSSTGSSLRDASSAWDALNKLKL